MRRIYWLSLLVALLMLALMASTTMATAYHSVTIDGDMTDWQADEVMEVDGPYTLYLTWDAANIYLGLTGATLGDDAAQDKSFFVCFDTDLAAGSGATADGYGNASFNTNLFAPEYCYYFAGGAGWYEWSNWTGSAWNWNTWRNDGTYYNWPGNTAPIPGSEVTVVRSDIGNPSAVRVVAWLTPEANPAGPNISLDASWPTPNAIGTAPTFAHAYHFPSLVDGISPNGSVLADHVVINEFKPKGTEWVELYNPTAAAVDIAGWYVDDVDCGAGTSFIGTQSIPAGGYYVVNANAAGDNFDLDNSGDNAVLCNAGNAEIDRVAYGYLGGAPIAHSQTGVDNSTARVPNGTDTDDYARDWNIDTTPTSGAPNTLAVANLGSSLMINEVEYGGASTQCRVELYNPTPATITLTNWLLDDGDAAPTPITTTAGITIPTGGFFVFRYSDLSGSGIGGTDVSYLFSPEGIRVDQLGFNGHTLVGSAQRVCDGAGPNDGYNWLSSGGGVTLFDLTNTYGSSNVTGSVDLGMAKTGPASASPGEVITYVITYQSATPIPGTSFIITDLLPVGVTYLSYEADPPLTLTGTDPLRLAGDSDCGVVTGRLTVTVEVDSSVPLGTELINNVEIAAVGDVNPENDTAQWTTFVAGVDMSVSKTGPADPLRPGDQISYTIAYALTGSDPAQDVRITDTFPVGFSYVTHSAGAPLACTPQAGSLVCTATLVSEPGQVIITGTIPAAPEGYVITNTVDLAASNDLSTANNSDQYISKLIVPISAIQYVPTPAADDRSSFVNSWVWVEGVVTADSDVFRSSAGGQIRYFIESPDGGPWSGLYIYKSTKPDVAEGDFVLLNGKIVEYAVGGSNQTELDLSLTGASQQIVRQGDPLPAPEVLDTGDLITAGTAEQWESVLTEFQAATVTNADIGNGEWEFDDGSGATIGDDWAKSGSNTRLTYTPALYDYYSSIRGIAFQSYGTYKLEPRYDADISLAWADLTTSTKVSDPAGQQVRAGDLVTYTITLINTGALDVTATAIDSLPGYYTVYDEGDFVEAPAGTLTWTGVVPGGGQVELQFVAQVIDGLAGLPLGVTPLANSVLVDDGIHTSFYVLDPLPPWVIKYGVYLPLVSRNQ